MIRKIVLPKYSDTTVDTYQVKELIKNEGVIIVFVEDDIVGSVIVIDGTYYLQLLDQTDEYDNLEDVLLCYPGYTFKFIQRGEL